MQRNQIWYGSFYKWFPGFDYNLVFIKIWKKKTDALLKLGSDYVYNWFLLLLILESIELFIHKTSRHLLPKDLILFINSFDDNRNTTILAGFLGEIILRTKTTKNVIK